MGKDRVFLPFTVRDADEPHRASTQLELFFDLVTVVAIASTVTVMHHQISAGHALLDLPLYTFGFFAIWWSWTYFTWFSSLFDNGDWVFGLTVLLMMTGFAVFAGGAGYMFETQNYTIGIAGWVIMRIALVAMWLRAALHNKQFKPQLMTFTIGIVVMQTAWVVVNVIGLSREIVSVFSGIFILLEMSVPIIAQRHGALPYHRDHLIERYGLLNIIVLGEGVLAVAALFGALHEGLLTSEIITAALSGMLIVSQLWWIYFQDSNAHLASTSRFQVTWWSYLHLPIYAAAALLGAGLAAVLDGLTHHAHTDMSQILWFVGGPVAVYFAALWLARDLFLPLGWRKAVLPLGALALLALCASAAPIWALALAVLITSVLRTTAIFNTQFQEEV